MRTIIEDTWFPASTRIRIGAGDEPLLFRHCTFEGGEIEIDQQVKAAVFSRCFFRGTHFTAQRLSEQIAVGCQVVQPATETTAREESSPENRIARRHR